MARTRTEAADKSVERLSALYAAKVRAELAEADGLAPDAAAVEPSGDPTCRVMLVKGVPGRADRAAGRALSGPDGEAATKAFEALDLGSAYFATCCRPASGERSPGGLERLALQIEAVDPAVIVALDAPAAEDVAAVLGLEELPFGVVAAVRGRRVLAVEGLEASLGDDNAKARVWRQLRTLRS